MGIEQQIKEELSTISIVRKVFEEADTFKTGKITKDKVNELLDDIDTRALLMHFGLGVDHAQNFFCLCDPEATGEVGIEEFACGLVRLRGWAKGVDVLTIMYENKRRFKIL